MPPPTPTVYFCDPPATPLDVSMVGPDWVIVTAHGSGFRPPVEPPDTQYWDGLRYRTRGTAGPGDGPTQGAWPVGNVNDTEFQFIAPACAAPCAVDISLRRRQTAPPDQYPGEWTDWIPCAMVSGSPPLPAPARMVPARGGPGTVVRIEGADLFHAKAVRIEGNDIIVAPPALGPDYIAWTAPDFAFDRPTALPVEVIYPDALDYPAGVVPAGAFTFQPHLEPAVEDWEPTEGSVDGGTIVHLSGQSLDRTVGVRLGAAAGQVLFVEWDEVIVATPPGEEGPQALTLVLDDGGTVEVGDFTYLPRPPVPPPVVDGFVPSSGPTTGGTVLTVTGANLDTVTEVRLGGTPATDLDAAFGRIICRTPPRPSASAVIVEIYWPEGRIAAPGLFEYLVVAPPTPEADICHRRAWLTLPDGRQLSLEDPAAGYVCVELDIGWPAVREVVNNRPDADGVDDRTALFGARVVTAHLIAGGMGGRRTMDDIVRAFGPYMTPRVRPILHWTVDSPETDYAERTLTLRASEFSAPIEGSFRDLHLAWAAPDPIVRAAVWRDALARPAYAGATGRRYDLTFDRVYPSGAGGALVGQISSPGDVEVLPLVRIFGPITGPGLVFFTFPPGAGTITTSFVFRSAFRIDAARSVEVDCRNHTVVADDGTRVEAQVDWGRSTWPVLAGGGVLNTFHLTGSSTDHVTQAIAAWRDGYLSI